MRGLESSSKRSSVAQGQEARMMPHPDYRPPNLELSDGALLEGYLIETVVPVNAAGEAGVVVRSHSLLFFRHSASTAGGNESRWVRKVTAIQILSSDMSLPDASFPNCPSQANIPE